MSEEYSRRKVLRIGSAAVGITITGTHLSEESVVESVDARPAAENGLNPSVQSSVFYYRQPDDVRVLSKNDSQFLFVNVNIGDNVPTEKLPAVADFTLSLGDTNSPAVAAINDIDIGSITRANGRGKPYSKMRRMMDDGEVHEMRSSSGALLFELPTNRNESSMSVQLQSDGIDQPRATWTLSPGLLQQATDRATFDVSVEEAPSQVSEDAASPITFRVTNTGTRDGTFRATWGVTSASHQAPIEESIPAGESKTVKRYVRFRPDWVRHLSGDESEVSHTLDYGSDTVEVTTEVR